MTSSAAVDVTIAVGNGVSVSALWQTPTNARAALVLGHGAGAGMRHPFMAATASELSERGIATLRYQFPYMEQGSRRPDAPAMCHATVRAAVSEASRLGGALPLFAGGKSFGGRMTSQAQAAAALAGVRGLVFLGFPLHPAKKPADSRAKHLFDVRIPMLFIQGTRDELADLALLEPITEQLGSRATLVRLEGADHSFHVLARSGRKDAEVLREAADAAARWMVTDELTTILFAAISS